MAVYLSGTNHFENARATLQNEVTLTTNADTSALEKEIDRIVYELYGLTQEEIDIVEGQHR